MSNWRELQRKKSRWIITGSEIKAFLLLFPFIPITIFNIGPIYDIATLLVIFYIIMLLLKKRLVLKKRYFLLIAYALWLSFSCLVNGRSVIPGIYYGMKLFCFTQLIEYYIQKKNLILFQIYTRCMTICIVFTLFFQIVSQDFFGHEEISGNYRNFAFGDNELGYYYIVFISVCIVLDRMKGKKISSFTVKMIILSLISLAIAWSAKAIVGIALILIYLFFVYGRKLAKYFNYWIAIAAYIICELGIVVFNIQEYFSYWIQLLLNKNASLTGRIGVWTNAIKNISNSPIYGYGVSNGGIIRLSTTAVGHTQISTHNLCLEILIQTGIVGLVLWALFVIISLYANVKNKSKAEQNIYYMLLFFTFVILFMQISSSGIYLVIIYLPMIICSNVYDFFKIGTSK